MRSDPMVHPSIFKVFVNASVLQEHVHYEWQGKRLMFLGWGPVEGDIIGLEHPDHGLIKECVFSGDDPFIDFMSVEEILTLALEGR